MAQSSTNLEGFEGKQTRRKRIGLGEPCAKKSKIEQQRLYNECRKEKPCKPQFSLNFQFDCNEKELKKETQERFIRLHSIADNLQPDHKNADFLMQLLDEFEGNPHRSAERNPKQHLVSADAKENSIDCEEAPSRKQLLSPAHANESFFVCGQDSLVVLLQETARGCPCGSPFFFDGDNSVKKTDGNVLRLEYFCKNGHKIKWASSSILGNKYNANCR